MTNIKISAGNLSVTAVLNDSQTARKIIQALPLEGAANIWGDEIYFDIAVDIEPSADAREAVEVGELGYWPMGSAFCLFFGPTPASTDQHPRAYSPVNVFGRIRGDATVLKSVDPGAPITVTRLA